MPIAFSGRCLPVRPGAECCGSDPPTRRHGAGSPGIDPSEHARLYGGVPGSEASLGELLEHCLVELSVIKKPLEEFGLGCFHPSVKLLTAVIGRGRHLQDRTDIGEALALVEQLLSSAQLADDLFGCVALALHGASPGQVWPFGKLS